MNGTNLLLATPEPIVGAPVVENKARLFRDRLFIKVHDRVVRLFLHEVLWVEAYDYYCKVATPQREYLVTQTLKKLGEALVCNPEMMRIHRSYIVNLRHIEEVGDAFVVIKNQSLPISKVVRSELLARWQMS